MKASEKSKKKLEKFLNSSREKGADKDKLNFNNNRNNNIRQQRKYQYEYSNAKQTEMKLNLIKNDDEEKNILLGLVKEGLITLNDYNQLQENQPYDINNIQFKEINLQKLMEKILFLNKTLKNTQAEKNNLENEHDTFMNAINESKRNSRINIDSQDNNNNKYMINNNYINMDNTNNNYINSQNILLKKYEDDLNYFNDLIKTNNNNDEFK